MRACVTGASGFVGSALCRGLLERGHGVVGLTRQPERARARIAREVSLVEGSVALPRQVAEAAAGCDVIFHAAGLRPGWAPPRCLAWLHVAGSENVLRAARFAKVRRVVHMSCADVSLSDEDRMHWNEERGLMGPPLSEFARSKLMAEELLLAQSGPQVSVVALRPAQLWGAGDIDGIAEHVRERRARSFTLYDQGRNLIATTHVLNLVHAAVLASEAPNASSLAYYVTDGEFLEAREWYASLSRALGLPAPPLSGAASWARVRARWRARVGKDGGAAHARLVKQSRSALFDLSRASRDLGYEPQVDLQDAFGALADWLDAQGGVDAVLQRASPPASEQDIAAQIAAADAAETADVTGQTRD